MNLKTTLILLVLVVAGGGLLYTGVDLPSWVNPAPQPSKPSPSGTREFLANLSPEQIIHLKVQTNGQVTSLRRGKEGTWSMPGDWPTWKQRVDALVERVGHLHSRFEAEPITADNLKQFGLAPPKVTIMLTTQQNDDGARHTVEHTLAFGRPAATGEGLALSRPTYLRLDGKDEVVALPATLLEELKKRADYYLKRRLFESKHVAREKGDTEKVYRLQAARVAVKKEKDNKNKEASGTDFQLVHEKDTWIIDSPVKDRVRPAARDKLLEAIPDLWAEKFVSVDLVAIPLLTLPPANLASAVSNLYQVTDQGLLARAGLDAPARTLTVLRGGTSLELQIGRLAPAFARERKEPGERPPGLPPNIPTPLNTVREEFRFAKLAGNDQVFLVKAEKLADVFVALPELRDDQVVRFQTNDVRRVEIARPGQQDVVLTRAKNAKGEETWKLHLGSLKVDADDSKVRELLDRVTGLRTTDKDVIDKPEEKYGLEKPEATLTLTVEEESTEGDDETKKVKKERTVIVRVGKHDTEAKKVYVQVAGWPRINAVEPELADLVQRQAVAYRGKRLFDFTESQLAQIAIHKPGEQITLDNTAAGWRLEMPVQAEADSLTVGLLTGKVGSLEVLEFVDDAPTPEDLDKKYGLARPDLTVTFSFKDAAQKPRTLEVGKARGEQPGYFARLDDPERPAVFAIASDVQQQLARSSLTYRPTQIWNLFPGDVTTVAIQQKEGAPPTKGGLAYQLSKKGAGWQITGPFTAPALKDSVQKIMDTLTSLRAESYKAHAAKDLKPFGLDAPRCVVTLTTAEGKKHTLRIGSATAKEAETHYAQRGDDPAVFLVGKPVVEATSRDALALLDPVLLNVEPGQIQSIVSEQGDRTLKLQRKDEGWQVLDAPGSPFTADDLSALFLANLWLELKAERYVAYGDMVDWSKYGLDRPEVTVTAVLAREEGAEGEAKQHTIALGNKVEGSDDRYVRVDKGSGVAVLAGGMCKVLSRTYLDYVDREILSFKADEVTGLSRQMGDQALELVKGAEWRLTKPKPEKADRPALQSLVGDLSHLRVNKVVAYPARENKDLAPYGLDQPVAVLTIKRKDMKDLVLKVGKVADPASAARYVMAGDSQVVGEVTGPVAGQLVAGPLAFRDRRLADFPDADRVDLVRGPRKASFSKEEGTWELIEPMKAPADHDLLEEFINKLARLRADVLVAENPDEEALKKYGLDRPEASWVLSYFGEPVLHLLIGKQEEKGPRRYARLARGNLVFLLDNTLSQRVVGEFRKRDVWETPLDAVAITRLHFGYPDNPFTLTKGLDGVWKAAGKETLPLNQEKVHETLAALAGLKLERYAVDKGADLKLFGLEKPALVLEITTQTGKRTLQLGNNVGESQARYARLPEVDRPGVFVLDADTSLKLFRALSDFAPPKKPVPPGTSGS
jgi:hypothetical protein